MTHKQLSVILFFAGTLSLIVLLLGEPLLTVASDVVYLLMTMQLWLLETLGAFLPVVVAVAIFMILIAWILREYACAQIPHIAQMDFDGTDDRYAPQEPNDLF